MSAWSPSYKDCDSIISDIYALTHTARMRRRAELGLDKLRMSDTRDECLSPRCLPRPSISTIQARPLPTPDTRYSEHIYQSPVRPAFSRRPPESGQYGFVPRQPPLTTRSPADRYQAQASRIPLAVSQQSVRPAPTLSPRRASGVQVQAPVTRLAGGQGSADLVRDKRLGARAVTELDFSRHRVPTPGGQVSARAPSITDNSEQSIASPGLSPGLLASDTCIRKGVMWVQQEKLFSRWKERFIILTPSYLHIFKKSTSRLSDMGTFVNKIRLSETENLSIEERKGYLTLVLVTARDSRLLLRKTEGIRDWQRSIQTQLSKEKQRHREMQSTNEFWNRKQFSDCQNAAAASQWLLVRDNIGHKYGYLSRMSPSNFHSETEDSGFESLVTITSDSSSNSSRMVSPHPLPPQPPQPPHPQPQPQPQPPGLQVTGPPKPHMINIRNGNGHHRQFERSHYHFYNFNNIK